MQIVKGLIGSVIGAVALAVLVVQIEFFVFDIRRGEEIVKDIGLFTLIIGAGGGALLLSKAKWLTILIVLIALILFIFIVPIPPK